MSLISRLIKKTKCNSENVKLEFRNLNTKRKKEKKKKEKERKYS